MTVSLVVMTTPLLGAITTRVKTQQLVIRAYLRVMADWPGSTQVTMFPTPTLQTQLQRPRVTPRLIRRSMTQRQRYIRTIPGAVRTITNNSPSVPRAALGRAMESPPRPLTQAGTRTSPHTGTPAK